ncbi:hypothetical protein ACFXKH_35875 [Streptomyces caelestis]|uniref:hypothetical protein n=1 Tax=Streptomyces caelestis TaxID=36816 RepID=UPI00368AC5E9
MLTRPHPVPPVADEAPVPAPAGPADLLTETAERLVTAGAVCGLLALAEARTAATTDPSTAAELCLAAVSHLSLAVILASVDLD